MKDTNKYIRAIWSNKHISFSDEGVLTVLTVDRDVRGFYAVEVYETALDEWAVKDHWVNILDIDYE